MANDIPNLPDSYAERLWNKVNTKDPSRCWEWQGAKIRDGYGYVLWKIDGVRRNLLAHRLAFYFYYHEQPGQECCHTCDNPACINPKHLYRGTHCSDMKDMIQRGRRRHAIGSHNGNTSLAEHDVKEIRNKYANGETQDNLATKFKVSQGTIHNIVHFKTWSHLN